MTESISRKFSRLGLGVSETGTLTVNSATATKWATARTLTLGGDLSGNVSIDGSENITLTATVSGNTVALGTDTTGDYVATVSAGTGITTTGTGESAAVTISIDNTVATLTGAQTLTNKTLTSPIISSISNTGTLTLPTSTDTLVGRATSDTLTNKTISGADNTLSNIGNSSLTNSSITINGTATSLGGTRTLVTDDISEDGTPVNLWYTDGRARAAISVTDAGGDGSLTYSSGVITYTGPSATEVRAHFTAGTGVTITSGQVAIGQAVGTSDNVTFAGVTADNIRVGVTGANEIDTSSGNLTLDSASGTTTVDDNATITGNLQVDGNLTVSGTTVTINATNLAVEDNMIYLNNGSAVTNPDLGIAGNYNDGTYRHAGLFRDATDGVWKFFHQYTPEPDASAYIDTAHASFALANVQAASFTGSLTGNASTASALATARNISLTGDVTGSASFDGSAAVSITATIAADSVALGTDTTGDYVASITNGNYITGGNGGSEGAALTLAVDATSSNTASKVVARDSSGNFSAGTITATLSGNASTVTNGVYTTDTGTVTNTMLAGSIANNKLSNSTISGISLGSNLGTLTMGVSGTGLSGSQTYNGSGAATFTVTSNATSTNTGSTIVARDSNGDFSGRYIFGVHFNQSSPNDENPSIAAFWTNSSSDNYNRKATPAHVISQLGLLTTSNYSSYALPLAGGTMSGAIVMSQAADWYMYGFGARGASSGAYGIGLTADIANRTLSYHVPNHAAYSSSGAVPKFGWYSNGADELMTLQSATGNLVVKGTITGASGTMSGNITMNTTEGEIIVSPTGWRNTERAAIKIRSKTDAPAEIDLRHTSGGIESGWHLSGRSAAESGPLNFYKFNMNSSGASDASGFVLMAALSAAGAFNTAGAITQNGSQVLHAGNYNSYSPTLTGTGASGTWGIDINGVINTTVAGGSVLIRHSVSEVDAWIFMENAANWGLYWKNAPTGQHTFGGYTSVGAELVGMSAANASGNGVATTNYVGATSAIAQWMISNYTGYIWSASTIYAATSMVVGGNTVLHAGNYGSYAIPLSGATFTGGLTGAASTFIRFGHSNESDSNDGKIGASLFASGLNIVGTRTVVAEGRVIRLWGSVITDTSQPFLHSGNYSSYALPLSGGTLTGQLNANTKRTNFGVSGNWDGAGFSQQTNVHMQGHDHFWIGAGNAYWYRGAIATEHDLLITTMYGYDSTSYYRGITFAAENTGAGNSGYRLGRWQTYGTSWAETRLQVDASLSVGYGARGTNSDYLDNDAGYWPLDRGVWRHGVNESGYGDRRGYIFSPSANGGGPWGSFVSLEVSTPYRSGTLDIPALFRMHQWGSGSAEFWKPLGTILYLRESPGGGNTWFTKFVVQRTIESNTEVRAPIFKDTDNDAYYLNLAGDGTQAGNINGNIRINPKSETWAEGISFNMPTQATWGGLRWVRSYSGSFTGNWALGYLGTESSNDMAWWSGDNSVKWRLDHSGNMTSTGNVTAYSDVRLKKNIQRIENALEKVNKINGYTFERTDVQTSRQAGVIAQEVLEVLPEVVLGSEETQYSVAYGNMVGLLIEAIKEQDVKIEKLIQEIKRLSGEQ